MTPVEKLPDSPALSVVLITPDVFDTVRTTVRHLNAQTIAGQIELIIAAPVASAVHVPPEAVSRLRRCKVVEVGALTTMCSGKVKALSHATAPIIAFAEDHSFPEPDWAAALLDGHARGYTGVMPAMLNANPRTFLSWSAMFMHFGAAVEPIDGEVRYGSASHNTSYRRDALLELADELPRLMLVELFLQDALHARGHRFLQQPAARTRHVQATRPRAWVGHGFIGGRLYGGLRVELNRWPLARRMFMVAASPLIPLLRLRRVVREIRRTSHGPLLLPRLLPHLITGLVIHAAGEVTGYILGVGDSDVTYSEFEAHRYRNTAEPDRVAWT